MLTGFSASSDSESAYGPALSIRDSRASFTESFDRFPMWLCLAFAIAAVVLGSIALIPLWIHMHTMWSRDPLRAMGEWFPLISLFGVLASWRQLRWDQRGNNWGSLLIALSLILAWFFYLTNPQLTINEKRFFLGQWGIVLFVYGAGAALFFGGVRLLRAALAPLCLLLFISPVPQIYNSLVDMPLQQFSAATARDFAHLIGLHPTGEQLRMMFAPNFGMMIVPGCNGVRGSVALSYLALIYGYTRRLRPTRLALFTAVSLLAGFALNLLRLCLLVVYYRLGLSLAAIRPYGAEVDYAIGGTLFLFATLALGLLIRFYEPQTLPAVKTSPVLFTVDGRTRHNTMVRASLLLLFACAAAVPQIPLLHAPTLTDKAAFHLFPEHVGEYRLVRTSGEQIAGSLVFVLGHYEAGPYPGHEAKKLDLGFWLGRPDHLVASSKMLQGIEPRWTGAVDAVSNEKKPMRFYATYYDDGVLRQYDADTICSNERCSADPLVSRGVHLQFGIIRNRNLPLSDGKRLPVLLRREWPETDPHDPAVLRSAFEHDARQFIAGLNLRPIVTLAGSGY